MPEEDDQTQSMRPSDPDDTETANGSGVTVPEIAGYTILGRLGQGGMGTVWKAVRLSTRRGAALKLLSRRFK